MMYENQVSDELLDRWVTDVLLKHLEGMTGREIYEMIRWHQIPDGTILDSHVVNSYLYSNCWGYQAKYRYEPAVHKQNQPIKSICESFKLEFVFEIVASRLPDNSAKTVDR